jgi:hypothetical protein
MTSDRTDGRCSFPCGDFGAFLFTTEILGSPCPLHLMGFARSLLGEYNRYTEFVEPQLRAPICLRGMVLRHGTVSHLPPPWLVIWLK